MRWDDERQILRVHLKIELRKRNCVGTVMVLQAFI